MHNQKLNDRIPDIFRQKQYEPTNAATIKSISTNLANSAEGTLTIVPVTDKKFLTSTE